MLLKNFTSRALLPFKNLSTQARILQILRLFSTVGTLFFIIFTMVSPLITTNAHIARINCAHLDVSYGLYKSLRNSVSLTPSILDDSSTNEFPVDSSLTNSEISILTDYAESQVASAPQYIITTLWSWCYGNYNTSTVVDKHGRSHTVHHDDTIVCSPGPNSYVFDYRQELEAIGLSSILAYAFQTTKYDDQNYSNLVQGRHRQYRLLVPALTFCGATQLIILVFSLILYSNRGSEKDLTKLPSFLLNILALITVASFLSMAVASGIITRLLAVIRNEINSTLGDFGVALHLGNMWFSLLWLGFSFSLLVMVSWSFPLWCANPPDDEDEEYSYDFDYDNSYNHHYEAKHRRKSTSHLLDYTQGASSGGQRRHRTQLSGMRQVDDDRLSDDSENEAAGNNMGRNRSVRSERSNRSMHDNMAVPSGSTTSVFGDILPSQDHDVTTSDDVVHDENNLSKSSSTKTRSVAYNNHYPTDLYHSTADEEELRRLGESLSRKSSVRHLYKKSKSSRLDLLPEESETKHLLYNDTTLSGSQYPRTQHHYREETYDGYMDAHKRSDSNASAVNSRSNSYKNRNRSRSNSNRAINNTNTTNLTGTDPLSQSQPQSMVGSLTNSNSNSIDNIRGLASNAFIPNTGTSRNVETANDQGQFPNRTDSLQDRHYQHNTKNNPFLQSSKIKKALITKKTRMENPDRFSINESLLNEDEMNVLDHSNYVNHFGR